MYIHIYIYIHICKPSKEQRCLWYVHVHVYVYVYVCACACVCVCVCMYADFHEPRILRVCSKDTSSKDTSSKVCMLTFTNRASPSRKQRCLCVWATSRSTGPVPCIPCAAGS